MNPPRVLPDKEYCNRGFFVPTGRMEILSACLRPDGKFEVIRRYFSDASTSGVTGQKKPVPDQVFKEVYASDFSIGGRFITLLSLEKGTHEPAYLVHEVISFDGDTPPKNKKAAK